MNTEKKIELQNRYNEMWKTDWKEAIGAPIVAILIFAVAFFFFLFAT